MEQHSLFSKEERDQHIVFIVQDNWKPLFVSNKKLLVNAELIPDSQCDACHLAAYGHPMRYLGGHAYEKVCTIPLVKHGLISLERLMVRGGCCSHKDDFKKAKKLWPYAATEKRIKRHVKAR
jgi:hypothetical protein